MAYTFRIHAGEDAKEDGWQLSKELVRSSDPNSGVGSIDDSIEGGNSGKVGTSIPTPLARIYLFETAYTFVANKKKHEDFYDQLVTWSLDLLQLVFEKGKDEKLKIYEWNGIAQTQVLGKNGFKEGHKMLANSLHMSITSNPHLRTINLIEYDGVILGGTSPFTLTYTSPNAVRLLKEKNIELYTNDKSPLFKDRGIKHLKDRSVEFQRYVKWLIRNNVNEFTKDKTTLSSFFNYVQNQNLNISEQDLADVRESYFEKVRKRSDNGSVDVTLTVIGDLILRVNCEPVNMKESDFYMRPSVNCFGDGPVPIILPTDGDSSYDGWQYTKNESWLSYTTFDYFQIAYTKIEDRCLPTNGASTQLTTNKYPWLTTGDIFEEHLVLLGYDLNNDRFYFPNTGRTKPQFLLPIRREYFKYFTKEDLMNNLKCEVSYDSRNDKKISAVSFELKLKLQNKDYIALRRTYVAARHDERADFRIVSFSEGMSFGVFPFFRCDKASDRKNEYSVYLYGSSSDPDFAKLNFYKQNADNSELERVCDRDTDGRGEGVVRTSSTKTGYSKLYNLRGDTSNSFDFIEVEMADKNESCRGLALPLWIDLPAVDNNKETIVSIDFGTSNTYVAYHEDGVAKPLTIGLADQQMVLFNSCSVKHGTTKPQYRNAEDFGDAQYMSQYLREFVPSIIGHHENIADDEYVDYPIKTATVEKMNFSDKDSLFSGISIGFNIDNEKTEVDSQLFRYVTNLKWSAEEHKSKQDDVEKAKEFNKDKSRIKAFCDQTLWMIKNKLIMKGYSTKIKMIYFYPDSMSDVGRQIFKESWESSVKTIFTNRGYEVELKEELEAIAPYYSLSCLNNTNQDFETKSMANIDVGGGTTDYFILDQTHLKFEDNGAESGKAYEASIFFAGNDLWGATYPQSNQVGNRQHNGFVHYMQNAVASCSQEAQELYKCYGTNKAMADLSGFFFKNDPLFGFSDKVSNNEKFRFILFLHYAAVIYHLTDILKVIKQKDPEFKYPEILTFTGKGSEYINMISKQTAALSEMTTQLIRAFGIAEFKGVQIIRVENPKALTADGGIYEMMSDGPRKINLFDKDQFGSQFDSRSDKLTNTPYERIGKTCLGLEPREGGYAIKDVLAVKEAAMANVKTFADAVFHSDLLERTRQFLKFNLKESDYQQFMEFASDSYDTHARRFAENNISTALNPLEESVFFFAMKNSLINLSNYYFNSIKK